MNVTVSESDSLYQWQSPDVMTRLAIESRQRVIILSKNGFTLGEIKARLEEEGIHISKTSLCLLIKKYRETGSIADRPRARVPKKLTDEHYVFIDNALEKDDELTTRKLHHLLVDAFPNLDVSHSTVKRARRELGWVSTTPKYCQMIRENNKVKRLEWCKKMLKDKECFDDVIWTDESSVMIDPYSRKCYRRIGEPRKLKARAKHPAKVHVWGGISCRGATPCVLFTGIMISTKYVRILEAGLLPFVKDAFPDGHRFQQDNDPKHCSKYTRAKLVEHSVNWWPTPAESPDLNPIENVWGTMKTFLRNEYKPRNLESLKDGIRAFWKTLTPEKCRKFIVHLHTVIPKVIEKEGAASGY